MEFITAEQLYDKLKNKPIVELPDLVRVIEDVFHVSVLIEEGSDDIDVNAIANDPDVIRQIELSQKDREAGRIYNQEDGLMYLREKIREFKRGQNI